MSIILDALYKVQNKNHKYTEISQREMEQQAALNDARTNKTSKVKVAGIFAIIVAITFNVFLFNDEQDNYPPQLVTQDIPPPIDKDAVKTLAEVTDNEELVAPEDVPQETSDTEDLATTPAQLTTTEQQIDTSTNFEETTAETVDTSSDDLLPEEIDNEIPKNNSIIEEAIPHIVLDPVPEWITAGSIEFQKGSFQKAISDWTAGFKKTDPNTKFLSIMINYKEDLARDILYDLIHKNFPAFTLEAVFKHKKAYYTLVMPQQEAIETSKAAVKYHLDIDTFTLDKAEMLKRMHQPSRKAHKKRPTPRPVNIDEKISRAENYVMQGNYKSAIQTLKPQLKKFPDNWNLLFWLGSAQIGLHNFKQADVLLKRAQTINPNLPQLWTQRALIAQEQGDHVEALKHLFKAQDLAPNTPEIILNIAYSYEALGDKNGAAYSYKEFLRLTKDKPGYESLRQSAKIRLNDLVYQ